MSYMTNYNENNSTSYIDGYIDYNQLNLVNPQPREINKILCTVSINKDLYPSRFNTLEKALNKGGDPTSFEYKPIGFLLRVCRAR